MTKIDQSIELSPTDLALYIREQTDALFNDPQRQEEKVDYWIKLSLQRQQNGYSHEQLMKILQTERLDLLRSLPTFNTSAQTRAARYRTRVFHAIGIAAKVGGYIDGDYRFLVPAVKSKIGNFDFRNAGLFYLNMPTHDGSSLRLNSLQALTSEQDQELFQGSPDLVGNLVATGEILDRDILPQVGMRFNL